MKTMAALILITFSLFYAPTSHADSFGSGANTFDIEFVHIGNPGNVADTTGRPNPAGKVDKAYRIGKYEVSEQMIEKANTLGGLGIMKDTRGPDQPATSVTWFEAAQFVNWLNIDASSTPAYKFDGSGNFQLWAPSDPGYNPNNLYRNSMAKYFLPGVDEWYKAAFFDPNGGVYYDYPTGSNSVPDGIDFAGDTTFDAVFFDGGSNPQPNDITNVGVLSPYGTAGQGGNVWELEETAVNLLNNSSSSARGVRGGNWSSVSNRLLASTRAIDGPTNEIVNIGFRVASIPEPSTVLLGVLASVGVLLRKRR